MQVCPGCGAGLNVAKLSCEYCGLDIPNEGGIQYGVFIKEFGSRLQQVKSNEIDSSEKNNTELTNTSTLINSLFIPPEKDSLIQLAAFLIGQMQASSREVTLMNVQQKGLISAAWIGKATEVHSKLILMASMDSQIKKTVDLLEKTIKESEEDLSKVRRNVWLFFLGIFGIAGAIYLTVYFLSK